MTSNRFQRLYARLIAAGGFLMVLPGVFLLIGACLLSLVLTLDGSTSPTALAINLAVWSAAIVLSGGGFVAMIQGGRAGRDAPSSPMVLKFEVWILVATCCSLIALILPPLPPVVLATAIAWPMTALAWFARSHARTNSFTPDPKGGALRIEPATTLQAPPLGSSGLTWRRGLVAIAGGASISMTIGVALLLLLDLGIIALAPSLAYTAMYSSILGAVGLGFAWIGGNPAGALAELAIYVVLWPAVIGAVKPLIALPLLHRLDRRESFLVGAAIGAGVAMMETTVCVWAVLLAGSSNAPGPVHALLNPLLLVSAGAGIVHTFCSGLMTAAWRECLTRARPWLPDWLKRYGIAVGAHGLWNAGSAITIAALVTLTGAGRFSGTLALAAGALVVGLLALLAGLAWWGRRMASNGATEPETDPRLPELALPPVRAALAGVAVIVMLLPAGIALVQLIHLAR